MLTPENIALKRYEADYEVHMGVPTGETYPDVDWLIEMFILGGRTTRGERVLAPNPRWVHVSRVKPYYGTNEANIRRIHHTELQHICNVLNARKGE